MKQISIGEMRQRITFQSARKVKDGHGGWNLPSWDDFATVWAQVEPLSGREYYFAAQVKADLTHRVGIRYLAGLNEEMRIKFGDRYFEIESIIDLGELHKFMEILAREKKEE